MSRLFACAVGGCSGHPDLLLVLVHGQEFIIGRLGVIEGAILTEGAIMTQLDDRLAALKSELDGLAASLTSSTAEVDRALTDLKNALAGSLTADQAAAFDALDAAVASVKSTADGISSAVESADPTPAPGPAPTPAPTPEPPAPPAV